MARPAKLDDDEILRRSMLVFWRQGWQGTSIRDLEAALGLRAPSIYRRFGSKAGLFDAVLERYLERIVQRRIDRHLDGEGDPLANVEAFVRSALDVPEGSRRVPGCLVSSSAVEFAALPASSRARVSAGMATIRTAVRQELERAVEVGRLETDADVAGLTDAVLLGFQGLMVLARTDVERRRLRSMADSALAPLWTTSRLG